MPRILLLLMLFAPFPLLAEDALLTPEAFDALSRGKTLYFAQEGMAYGAEQYLPNRQSLWQFADGSCARGFWYDRDGLICFVYQGDPGEYCWSFLEKGDGGYAARAFGRGADADLDLVWQDREPLVCAGPDVGS